MIGSGRRHDVPRADDPAKGEAMLLGLDASIWKLLLVMFVFPLLAVAALNWLLRKRGGLDRVWSGVLILLLGGLVALLVIFDRVRL
jgi:hypothetical protein